MKLINETEDYCEYKVEAEDMEIARIDGYVDLRDLLVDSGACQSRRQAKRLIKQKAVRIDGLIEDVSTTIPVRNGAILNVGKHFWRRLMV